MGVGPGDPELITVKSLKLLKQAPVVAFPAGLRGNPGVAECIIEPWLSASQIRLPLAFPYGQKPDELEVAWHAAAK
ncbi:MAG: SAM-dependent methyltransferase, partial [Cyanobacteria bacterium J06649_4]